MTPVYVAAIQGQFRALKALLSAGAELNAASVVSIECVYILFVLYCIWNSNQGQSTEID